MTGLNRFFQSDAYHVIIALIYTAAGIALIVKQNGEGSSSGNDAIGWVIAAFGVYRLLMWLYRRFIKPKT